MPTYVTLVKYTDQGVRNIKESPARLEAAKKVGKVRMMTPGEMIRIRFRIPAATGGEIGFPY